VRRRGIAVRIARIGVESSQRLGRHRWIDCVPLCCRRLIAAAKRDSPLVVRSRKAVLDNPAAPYT